MFAAFLLRGAGGRVILGADLSPGKPFDSIVVADLKLMLRLVTRLAPHPVRAARALRAGWRFRARGWMRRPPFLPLPPREYIEWRLHTAYGSERGPAAGEVERYLRWADRMRRDVAERE